MKNKYIVANWKSHKTTAETVDWAGGLTGLERFEDKEVIVCPSFTAIAALKQYRDDYSLPFYLGVQNISPFEQGAYTGEVAASQAKELADYVILGHSERREHFKEDDELLTKKVQLAKAVGFSVIYCVQGKETAIPAGVDIVAYEPVFAIGSGSPDTPENADEVASALKGTMAYGSYCTVEASRLRTFALLRTNPQ
jgi:triosephosphate isomerase (TIM)